LLATLTVNTAAEATNSGLLSLRDAIAAVNAGTDSILPVAERSQVTGASMTGSLGPTNTINFSLGGTYPQTILLTNGELQITANTTLTITGPGAAQLSISGNQTSRIFDITNPAANVAISGLTLSNGFNGSVVGGGVGGGAIFNDGTLTITSSTISGSVENQTGGGAIANNSGTVKVYGSTLSGNTDTAHSLVGPVGIGGGAIYSTGTVDLYNSTITGNKCGAFDAYGGGGGIYEKGGTLNLTGCTLTGNVADNGSGEGYGGAIYSKQGSTTVTNCTIGTVAQGNTARAGGGLSNSGGSLTVTNSTVSGNTAEFGGGILSSGPLTVTGSTISYNTGTLVGGGIEIGSSAAVTISNSTVSNNRGGYGGGIEASGGATISISGSIIANNSATGNGGGIAANWDKLTLQNSTVSGNSAQNGGGIFNGCVYDVGSLQPITKYSKLYLKYSQVTANSASLDGGGIDNAGGNLTVTDSTVSGNTAGSSGGGIAHEEYYYFSIVSGGPVTRAGPVTVYDSTISGNHAVTAGGGGIYNKFGTATVTNSTISGNTASDVGSGIYNENNGTLTLLSSTISGNSFTRGAGPYYTLVNVGSATAVTLSNTIVAGNAQGSIFGNVNTSTSYNNLIGTKGYGGLSNGTKGNIIIGVASPGLSALSNFGGPTQTMALLPGSAAYAQGDTFLAPTSDQRGFTRIGLPQKVDIGAFQTQPVDALQVNTSADPGGILQSGTDLSTTIGTSPNPTVSSGSYQFQTSDIGSMLGIVASATTGAGSGWQAGLYLITAVNSNGQAILAAPNGVGTGGALSSGTWELYGNARKGGQLVSSNGTSTSPTVSSVNGCQFQASDVGAMLTIFAGSNWTPGTYQIVSVSGGAATLAAPSGIGTVSNLSGGMWYIAGISPPTTPGTLSLREAVNLADALSGGGISFGSVAGQTINLTSGQLVISANVSVLGPMTINGSGLSRIFDITSNSGSVNISGLTLTSGLITSGGGGAIRNNGTLMLTNSIVTGSTDTNGSIGGGGVTNYGTLTLNYCTVSYNTSTQSEGGGIENRPGATLHVNHSTISGNIMSAGGSAGGGITNEYGTVTVNYSNIYNNYATAGFGGGGIFERGVSGTLTVTNSTISDNHATAGGGGGLFQSYGTTTLTNCTISGNTSSNTGNGAAIYINDKGALTLTSCTVSGNSAVQNSGGIYANTTFATPTTVTLDNTIVAGNTGNSGGIPESDLSGTGTFTSSGYNAFGSTGGVITKLPSDIVSALVGSSSNLDKLKDNGGPVAGCPGAPGTGAVKTMALLANNPAVGAGDHALLTAVPGLTNVDERGTARGVAGTVDIGAYAANKPSVLSVTTSASPQAGTGFVFTVTAVNAAGFTTPGYNGTVQFTTSDTNGLVQLPANATFNPAANKGILNVTATLITEGTQTITVTDTGTGSIAGTLSTTVSPGPLTNFEIVGLPSTSTALLLQPVAFEGVDAFGNIVAGFAGKVTFSCTDGNATVTFPGNNPPPAVPLGGFTYTFPGGPTSPDVVTLAVAFNTNGVQTITATSGTINFNISTTVVGASVVTPTSQTAQVVPTSGTQTVSNSNLSATISGGNEAQTTLAVAANYNSNPTGMNVVVNGTALNAVSFNDFRVVNPTATTTVTLYLTVPAGAAANTQAVFFVDGGWVDATPQVRIGNIIIVTLSASSTPTISQLNGTVFAIAVPVGAATSSSTVGVFPPLASNETQPAVQASFVSSSSLSLTLSPLQQGTLSTSQATNTGGGDGDGASDSDIQAMWDYLNDFWRMMLIGFEQLPSGKDVGVVAAPAATGKGPGTDSGAGTKTTGSGTNGASGTGVKPSGTGGEAPKPQSRRTNDARDAFFATAVDTAELPIVIPGLAAPDPALTANDRYGASALLGLPCLAVMLEEVQLHRARRAWRGLHSEPAVAH